jgi:hypothetical protein
MFHIPQDITINLDVESIGVVQALSTVTIWLSITNCVVVATDTFINGLARGSTVM